MPPDAQRSPFHSQKCCLVVFGVLVSVADLWKKLGKGPDFRLPDEKMEAQKVESGLFCKA